MGVSADEAQMSNWLRAALAGDEKAYADFLSRAAALVRLLARRRIVHGGVDPEDVVQETLLAIHLKRHTWRTDAPVLPWLFAVARHKLVDAFRKRGQRIEVDIADFAESLPSPSEDKPRAVEIDRALDSLPAGQRQVVSAISVEGRSITETARLFDMNETAVRVAFHRGLSAIAKRFGGA